MHAISRADLSVILAVAQAALLLVTAAITFGGYYFTVRALQHETEELRRTLQGNARAALFQRLFDVHRLLLETGEGNLREQNPVPPGGAETNGSTRDQHIAYAIADLLHWTFLESATLDEPMRVAWRTWASRALALPGFSDVLADYPDDFVAELSRVPARPPMMQGLR